MRSIAYVNSPGRILENADTTTALYNGTTAIPTTDVVNMDTTFAGDVLMLTCMRRIARDEGRLSKRLPTLLHLRMKP